jgi:hypothetical protein
MCFTTTLPVKSAAVWFSLNVKVKPVLCEFPEDGDTLNQEDELTISHVPLVMTRTFDVPESLDLFITVGLIVK